MRIRVLRARDIEEALPIPRAIALMRSAFIQLSAGEAQLPPRVHIETPRGVSLIMPGYLQQSGDLAVKIVSVFGENPQKGLPLVPGLVAVLDDQSGMPTALLDGHSLTLIRTGATGGLAADLLAREDTHVVAVIGAGGQGRVQLQGVRAVRRIQSVVLFDHHRDVAERLAAEVAAAPDAPEVRVATSANDAVREVDLVITATSSTVPVFDGNALAPGAHVTAIGSFKPSQTELDATAVRRARVFVDHRDSALSEAGDLIAAGVTEVTEIGDVAAGNASGRETNEEITLFKTVGVAVQDAVASTAAARTAEELDLGTVIEL
jgi:ornithine cyclodeaminase/alanine dehydrogenase-like protein (mu-crystallin family)